MLILTPLGKTSIRSLDPSTFIATWPTGQPCERKLFHTDYAVERWCKWQNRKSLEMHKKQCWSKFEDICRYRIHLTWRTLCDVKCINRASNRSRAKQKWCDLEEVNNRVQFCFQWSTRLTFLDSHHITQEHFPQYLWEKNILPVARAEL